MSRVRINMPLSILFKTELPVRITDINYGGHVGNDSILSIVHEIRVQFLKSLHYDEFNVAGAGLIMSDAVIEFKNELFYGEIILASLSVENISKVSFDLFYKLEKNIGEETVIVAIVKTGMVCYDYSAKKIIPVPKEFIEKIQF